MKIKKRLLSLALAATMALGLMPGMTMTALADGDTSYTLTIPSTLSVANSGWNATDGISATGTLASGKKLTVTASSANSFKLKSGDNSVGYKLATASTEATTSWTFDSLSSTATKKDMGIIVEDYSTKPAGTYQDTVTFTAKVENAASTVEWIFSEMSGYPELYMGYTYKGVTISGDGDLNFGDGLLFAMGSDLTFTAPTGKHFKSIVINTTGFADITGWTIDNGNNNITSTWTGDVSSVTFSGMAHGITSIVFTLE